ncbi:MAG TPA: hypothetical protein VEI03_14345 [Stellaceae bacterium]|nr:hypothetical protein [Stellaceae bacterium]
MTARPPVPRASAAEIAAEIARTRDRLSRGLARLDRDYALRHLAVRAVRLARKAEFDAGKLRETLRRDGLPLAVIGVGLGWLSFAGSDAGRDLLQRLGSALAALQQLGREFGVGAAPEPLPPQAAAIEPPAPTPPLSDDFSP